MKKNLEIIFTSDIHGHIFPVDYAAGKPEESGLLNMAHQVKKGADTLILDGGDSLQGTPLSQYYIAHRQEYPLHPVAEAFNALGCDYFTLGNHDFNFGYEVLRDYLKAMKARCVCANVIDKRGELELIPDAVHVMENGLRVGITGIVTDYVMIWEQPGNLEHITVTDAFEAARREYEKLKDICDITICIYHGGFERDLQTGQLLAESRENVACQMAEELGYDILLTGHQHMMVEGVNLAGTYAVQPPANATYFMRLNLEWTESDGSAEEPCGSRDKDTKPESVRRPDTLYFQRRTNRRCSW